MRDIYPLAELAPHQYPELYRLMVAGNFPAVPPRYSEAEPYFRQCRIFYVADREERVGGWTRLAMKVAFVFGPQDDDRIAFLDVVCARREQGRWASLAVLKAVFRVAFGNPAYGHLGLRCLWVEPHHDKALRACLQAGFQPINSRKTLLAMTPHGLPPRFRDADRTTV